MALNADFLRIEADLALALDFGLADCFLTATDCSWAKEVFEILAKLKAKAKTTNVERIFFKRVPLSGFDKLSTSVRLFEKSGNIKDLHLISQAVNSSINNKIFNWKSPLGRDSFCLALQFIERTQVGLGRRHHNVRV